MAGYFFISSKIYVFPTILSSNIHFGTLFALFNTVNRGINMTLKINKIQNQLQNYEIDGLLITKKKTVNTQQTLQVAQALS